jgi:hypothetical protein
MRERVNDFRPAHVGRIPDFTYRLNCRPRWRHPAEGGQPMRAMPTPAGPIN